MVAERLASVGRRLLSLPDLSSKKVETSGLHAYTRETPLGAIRFHLRIEPDGSALLLCNATNAARLNPSGVVMARAFLEGAGRDEALRRVTAQFRGASQERIEEDVSSVETLLEELSDTARQYPVMNLDDPALSPRASRLMAPFQAGVVLGPPEQVGPILERLWSAGVPHVNFRTWTHHEPEHLVRAVERAEDIGMIAGARVVAHTVEPKLLEELVAVGLDHLMIPAASTDAAVHDALYGEGDHAQALALLDQALNLGTCAVAEVPLLKQTVDGTEQTLEMLAEKGVANASFWALALPPETAAGEGEGALTPSEIVAAADLVEEATYRMYVRFFWQPPVRRDPSTELVEQVQHGPRATGDVSVLVEPDGSVIPARGPREVAGNLLREPWNRIWQHDAFRRYRERVEANTRCGQCPELLICAADCPREPAGWSW